MIYDAIEGAYTVVLTNFATDLAALATAKGVTITTTASIVKRQKAETFGTYQIALPAVGVYGKKVVTQGKSNGYRDNLSTVVFDYYAVGPDPVILAKQAELAAEALLKSIDRLNGADPYGAGVLPGSITVEFNDGFEEVQIPNYARRAIVTCPVWDQDTGL